MDQRGIKQERERARVGGKPTSRLFGSIPSTSMALLDVLWCTCSSDPSLNLFISKTKTKIYSIDTTEMTNDNVNLLYLMKWARTIYSRKVPGG